MSLLISWLILTVAVWATASVLPGFHVKDFKGALIVSAIFGLLNFVLGWLLFLTWERLTQPERLMRIAVLALAIAVTIVELAPR